MIDFIIKNRFKGIFIILLKRDGDIMKRVAKFKGWVGILHVLIRL